MSGVISATDLFNWLLIGMAFGIGFVIPVYFGVASLFLKLMGHSTVRKLANAADKLAQGGTGGLIEKVLNGLFK